ncbi:hypothetical protein [Hoyosella altamirensis]|uniref:Uncharacterized protein n=1 Tax=Hoyosella altamirensis TaxID=616997 RepID=A0A839RVK1_9ACTN|nr:hypothetical protein [Hoyosella altamirensis]MBB3040044.1 hypothetical protein [Hoyosella altamirensis]
MLLARFGGGGGDFSGEFFDDVLDVLLHRRSLEAVLEAGGGGYPVDRPEVVRGSP